MLMPPIERYMTPQPWTIEPSKSLGDARAVMREHGIRHLPVVADDRLVGIVSIGDILLLESCGVRTARVREAMSEAVYTVHPKTPVDEVVRTLSQRKLGSVVIVTDGSSVAGIFTMVDACRTLAEVLDRAVA